MCEGIDTGNTCCPETPWDSYVQNVIPWGGVSCALLLLDVWERPWSPTAMRYANHALVRAYNRGCDVLESDKPDE